MSRFAFSHTQVHYTAYTSVVMDYENINSCLSHVVTYTVHYNAKTCAGIMILFYDSVK